MMMITEDPEEMQAFATRRPADGGPTHYSPRGARPDCRVHFTHEGAPSKLAWVGFSPRLKRIRLHHPLT